jgi:hypothetical protein
MISEHRTRQYYGYVERSEWSVCQSLEFVTYLAALRGLFVVANAGFTLALRPGPVGQAARGPERPRSGRLIAPYLGTEAQQCV